MASATTTICVESPQSNLAPCSSSLYLLARHEDREPSKTAAGISEEPPGPEPPKDVGLVCLPSKALKSPLIEKLSSGKRNQLVDAKRDKLIIEELKARRLMGLARARRLKNAAQESKALRDLQEALVLQNLADKKADLTRLKPQAAADLARVVRETLTCTERLAHARVLEAKEKLEALKEAWDLARSQLKEADSQMVGVFSALKNAQIEVAPTASLIADFHDPLPPHIPLTDSPDSLTPDASAEPCPDTDYCIEFVDTGAIGDSEDGEEFDSGDDDFDAETEAEDEEFWEAVESAD